RHHDSIIEFENLTSVMATKRASAPESISSLISSPLFSLPRPVRLFVASRNDLRLSHLRDRASTRLLQRVSVECAA
ncbi:MAG: hypothetical protein AAF581_14645, partial [Planctomycetota bacterium]